MAIYEPPPAGGDIVLREVAGNIVGFPHGGEREVGYWIGRPYWGRGVATAALRMFLGHERTRPLFAHVATHNAGSIRVLEKNGFVRCGEEQGWPDAEGEVIDEFVFRLG